MKRVWRTIGKAITGGVGLVVMATANGVLTGNALVAANVIIVLATFAGIYHAPYAPTSTTGK